MQFSRFVPAPRYWLLAVFVLAVSAGAAIYFFDLLLEFYCMLTDRQTVASIVEKWEAAAPLVFVGVQILQVIAAPLPGEISGLVGGYLFGAGLGFLYSSIGLALGSAANFWIGRLLGYRLVRKWIPSAQLERMDGFLNRQGIIVVLTFFMFPGFPKDYLSLFLGGTAMPFALFIILAGLGRMPGTLLLSLHGDLLFEKMYAVYGVVLALTLAGVLLAIYYRKALYAW
ncbi:MAG TPA: VTT domain-containing protein, partial [Desulfosalsimonadaceae bacterium]|nr:VTT domain-containing protein [Desulfosalsimonadaceae bacterium]